MSKFETSPKSEFDALLTLLSIAIFIDEHVANSELDIFKKAVARLKITELDVPKLSEAQAHAWFNQNYENIRLMMSKPQKVFEMQLVSLLDRIAAHAKRDALVHIIHMISLADGSIHQSEVKLIDFVKRHWGVA